MHISTTLVFYAWCLFITKHSMSWQNQLNISSIKSSLQCYDYTLFPSYFWYIWKIKYNSKTRDLLNTMSIYLRLQWCLLVTLLRNLKLACKMITWESVEHSLLEVELLGDTLMGKFSARINHKLVSVQRYVVIFVAKNITAALRLGGIDEALHRI